MQQFVSKEISAYEPVISAFYLGRAVAANILTRSFRASRFAEAFK
ncbi:hypothetical protein AGMMS49942_00050 [Spirochaetia bacterium]|nr:hypothetical protein AGMMS49942_00050 [Spirochaetia bacterium]